MISQMAKPEEVLIVEDENGDIVRETTKDTDVLAQYKTMRDTLVYLTHLDAENTETIMLVETDGTSRWQTLFVEQFEYPVLGDWKYQWSHVGRGRKAISRDRH